MSDQEKTKVLLENLFYEHPDLEGKLLEVAVRQGVAFKHPRTGKWHDKSGLGFDTEEGLIKYGDAFIFEDDEPFELR